jgi:hypothetical protein
MKKNGKFRKYINNPSAIKIISAVVSYIQPYLARRANEAKEKNKIKRRRAAPEQARHATASRAHLLDEFEFGYKDGTDLTSSIVNLLFKKIVLLL